jgi:zinc transporter ZupT
MVWQVFWVALLTDLATGLGALPFAVVRKLSDRWQGLASALAGGMMLSASVFTLADKALHQGHPWRVIAGMVAGALFLAWTARFIGRNNWQIQELSAADSRQSILMLTAMFVHSIPEGIAIGVGYATGELSFGFLLAFAIAIHNIPEGIAVALPLRAKGISVWACFWYAVLTSVPQPLAAVPSYLVVSVFQPLLPTGLGFAGGAMIFLVAGEMMPDSLERCSRHETAWGVMVGLIAMLWLTSALGL